MYLAIEKNPIQQWTNVKLQKVGEWNLEPVSPLLSWLIVTKYAQIQLKKWVLKAHTV